MPVNGLEKAPYRDPSLPVDKRAADLLARMTLEEKVAQLGSVWLSLDPDSGDFAPNPENLAGGAPPQVDLRHGIGQITRPFGSQPVEPEAGVRALNEFQRRMVEETRLGIPAIAHEESLTGFMALGATQFPSPLNFGSTWDPELVERVGAVIRRQMRAVGTHLALAPVADVIRDARWGRVEECVAEDPYLVGCMVSAYVRGLQGDDPATGVAATLKHFCAYSSSQGGRNFAPAHVGPRELADVFLIPFEMAVVGAGARSVMNAYQDIDGVPPAASRELLTGILRERWDFDGIVVSDYFSVKMLETLHRVAATPEEAAAAALSAGLDVELPRTDCFEALPAALEAGLIDVEAVDRAVLRVLRLKLALGLFEHPYAEQGATPLETGADRALARRVAEASITLLQNDGLLPLPPEPGTVAVVGPNAHDPMALFGNYSFQNHVASHFPDRPLPVVAPTLLDVLRERLGAERVCFAEGCAAMGDVRDGIAEAAGVAARADLAILVVGDKAGHFRRGTVGEGTDTDDLGLPGVQAELAEAVLDTGTPTVAVLINGRPFDLSGLSARAAAIVEAWFPGQDGAAAIAGVLFGDVNPGGRTTVSHGRGAGAQPMSYDHKRLARGLPQPPYVEPVFPFGHGLGYTRFEYADLEIGPQEIAPDGAVEVACTVRNAGERAGDEVVQLYLRDPVASVTRPVEELVGFRRVTLEPGASCRVVFEVSADRLSFTARDLRRVVEPGEIEVRVGASSADVRLEGAFRVVGSVREVGPRRVLETPVRVEE